MLLPSFSLLRAKKSMYCWSNLRYCNFTSTVTGASGAAFVTETGNELGSFVRDTAINVGGIYRTGPANQDLALRFKGFRVLLAALSALRSEPSDAELDQIVAKYGADRFLDALQCRVGFGEVEGTILAAE